MWKCELLCMSERKVCSGGPPASLAYLFTLKNARLVMCTSMPTVPKMLKKNQKFFKWQGTCAHKEGRKMGQTCFSFPLIGSLLLEWELVVLL